MRFALRLFALFSFVAIVATSGSAPAQLNETQIKATFLYRFASFVTWPQAAFASSDTLQLCVVGADPFRAVLDSAAAGQQIGGHAIVVRRLRSYPDDQPCHVLFVSGGQQSVAQVLRAARGEPVLTVTDASRSPEDRGMVHFVLVDDRVRFHIDEALAAESGLMISPRLLSLAVSVRRRA